MSIEAFEIDLDADRDRRAAEREAQGIATEGAPIRVGGKVIAHLPNELPLDVFAPLRTLDDEIALLIRSMLNMLNKQGGAESQMQAVDLMVDMLVANPTLPTAAIDVIIEMTQTLIGEQGYVDLVAARLRREDLGFIAKRVAAFYGVSLGESKPPSTSQTEGGGETSSTTSESTSASTPVVSGEIVDTPTSSESAGS